MPRQQGQHVIEEADARINLRLATAIDVDADGYRTLACGAFYLSLAHHFSLKRKARPGSTFGKSVTGAPSAITRTPLTSTCSTPALGWCGFSNVARSSTT